MNLRTLGLTKKFFLTFIILSIIGALMIYSASSYDLLMQGVKPTAVFIKQGIIMCLSWVLMFVIYKVRLEVLFNKNCDWTAFLVSILLLLMVRLPFFGVATNGAQRWISLFGIQFQPSELCNFAIIYYLSCYLGEKENGFDNEAVKGNNGCLFWSLHFFSFDSTQSWRGHSYFSYWQCLDFSQQVFMQKFSVIALRGLSLLARRFFLK